MPLGLYLKLDQNRLFHGDYSDTDKLTGTIYTDSARTTPKNLTGYTIKLRFYVRNSFLDYLNKTADIVSAANGTFSVTFTQADMPLPSIYLVKAEISKSGSKISTVNSVELLIKRGPTG